MEPGSTTKSKTPASLDGEAGAAGLGVTPAERQLDSWEEKVLNELEELEKKWVERRKELLSEAKTLREQNAESAIDKAVNIEEYVSVVNGLFNEAKAELSIEIDARLEGNYIDMASAAKRVNEALDFLRILVR